METIKLVAVSKTYQDAVMVYKQQFLATGDSMDGTAGLKYCDTFEQWQDRLIKNSNKETLEAGLVPATTLLAISEKDNRLIGMVDIRHSLSEHLRNYGGHIGYSVSREERRKGFATQILMLALKECQTLNIQNVLVTCLKSNIGSARTIINNGGVLDNEIRQGDGKLVQRYWINR